MNKPLNAIQYLNMIQKQKGTEPSLDDLADYLDAKARKAGVPLSGQFELTPLCNFSCKMCYVHLMKDQLGEKNILTAAQWKLLMGQACEAGMVTATLTGGECLAYPDFEDLYLYLQSQGCAVIVMTNGFLLDEERIRFFQAHRPSKIQITLYGSNDDVYEQVTGQRAFGQVTRNIRSLIDAGILVTVSVTPNSYMGEDVLETLRTAYSLCSNVRINPNLLKPREETGRSGIGDDLDLDQYVRLYRLEAELSGKELVNPFEGELPEAGGSCCECVRGMLCGGGRTSFAMNWKGIMTFCGSMEAVCFDALKEGFPNAWKKLNQAAKDWPNAPECIGCAYESVCPTCSANEYHFAEPGKQPLPLCERTKYLVQHGVWNIPVCE